MPQRMIAQIEWTNRYWDFIECCTQLLINRTKPIYTRLYHRQTPCVKARNTDSHLFLFLSFRVRDSRRQTGTQVEDVRTEEDAAADLFSPVRSIGFHRSLTRANKSSSIAACRFMQRRQVPMSLPITNTIQHLRIRLRSRSGKKEQKKTYSENLILSLNAGMRAICH